MSKKVWMFISIILTILLGVSIYNNYKRNAETSMYREIFVNHFYFEINDTINLLSNIGEGDGIEVQNNFKRIVNKLARLESIIADANAFMDRDLYYTAGTYSMRRISAIMSEGYIFNNQKICDGFLADDNISKNELNFLTSLKEDLEQIKNKMYSNETKQENPNLTIQQINNILAPFFSKYCEIQELNLSN